jgi:hypothetical protein
MRQLLDDVNSNLPMNQYLLSSCEEFRREYATATYDCDLQQRSVEKDQQIINLISSLQPHFAKANRVRYRGVEEDLNNKAVADKEYTTITCLSPDLPANIRLSFKEVDESIPEATSDKVGELARIEVCRKYGPKPS